MRRRKFFDLSTTFVGGVAAGVVADQIAHSQPNPEVKFGENLRSFGLTEFIPLYQTLSNFQRFYRVPMFNDVLQTLARLDANYGSQSEASLYRDGWRTKRIDEEMVRYAHEHVDSLNFKMSPPHSV